MVLKWSSAGNTIMNSITNIKNINADLKKKVLEKLHAIQGFLVLQALTQ